MAQSFREALEVVLGDTAGKLTALAGLAAVVVGALIDPVAGALVAAVLLAALVATFVYALRQRALSSGPYDVLDETITWLFEDDHGQTVRVTKRQNVRFNFLTITLVELAAGDGVLFADFECNYGEKLKDVKKAGEVGILLEMTPERTRDEKFELTSTRTIKDGFTAKDEWVVFRASVPSDSTELVFLFPGNVKDVRISGPGGRKSRPAKEDKEIKTQGSQRVLTMKRHFKPDETIKVTWTW
ncbi:MAG: hypothetical protein JO027_19555 [Solirubrobacterales bacterium]|nr:hypothetical protein [Solirubrobacterales bacterium]